MVESGLAQEATVRGPTAPGSGYRESHLRGSLVSPIQAAPPETLTFRWSRVFLFFFSTLPSILTCCPG